jgi:hypothetical protein
MVKSFWMVFVLLAIYTACVAVALFAQTSIAPNQLRAPRVSVLQCSGTTSLASDCTGFYYVDVATPSGTELKIIGTPATAPIDPAHWAIVP